jgi:hypothetical protein
MKEPDPMQKKFTARADLTVLAVCIIFSIIFMSSVSAKGQDFGVLTGDWVRSDGDYSLRVQNVDQEGSVNVTYFNPNPIHVAEANVSLWKGMVKLFVKLQDKGYPGSTYTLYYFEEKDSLAGFYFQATMGQTYEVVFTRKKPAN